MEPKGKERIMEYLDQGVHKKYIVGCTEGSNEVQSMKVGCCSKVPQIIVPRCESQIYR
jgi:hypothetical protein